MLFHLEPSAEMTGGPWYTDKELDTEFIKLLSQACLKFIADRVRVFRLQTLYFHTHGFLITADLGDVTTLLELSSKQEQRQRYLSYPTRPLPDLRVSTLPHRRASPDVFEQEQDHRDATYRGTCRDAVERIGG